MCILCFVFSAVITAMTHQIAKLIKVNKTNVSNLEGGRSVRSG